jgi:hypothetical protein
LFDMPDAASPISFDFAEALTRMKAGASVTRLCWKGDGRRVLIWRMHSGVGFIRLSQYYGHMVEWQARDADLLGDDWVVYDGERWA